MSTPQTMSTDLRVEDDQHEDTAKIRMDAMVRDYAAQSDESVQELHASLIETVCRPLEELDQHLSQMLEENERACHSKQREMQQLTAAFQVAQQRFAALQGQVNLGAR